MAMSRLVAASLSCPRSVASSTLPSTGRVLFDGTTRPTTFSPSIRLLFKQESFTTASSAMPGTGLPATPGSLRFAATGSRRGAPRIARPAVSIAAARTRLARIAISQRYYGPHAGRTAPGSTRARPGPPPPRTQESGDAAWRRRSRCATTSVDRRAPLGAHRDGRHAALRAVLPQLGLEDLADARVLVLVLDLAAALLHAHV